MKKIGNMLIGMGIIFLFCIISTDDYNIAMGTATPFSEIIIKCIVGISLISTGSVIKRFSE